MWTDAELKQECCEIQPYALEIFRLLHSIPEKSGEEFETNRVIREGLEKAGVEYLSPLDNLTIAVIRGAQPGHTVGLRCDTDALPVQEETGLPYASRINGVMHACGHDGHVTIGLCTAKLLAKHREDLCGTVKIIFQSAEEIGRGAEEAIHTGLIDDVDVFFAIHLWSPFESGTLRVSPIVVSAAVDAFDITITGRGGHGATPDKCADALLCASELVTALQSIVARNVPPTEPAVLMVGSFHAGTAYNIVAETAELKGTIRTVDEETRKMIVGNMTRLAEGIAAGHGCKAHVRNVHRHDVVRNDPGPAKLAHACALRLAEESMVQPQRTMMLGDDFCAYNRIAPCCYVQVGIADEQKGTHAAHHNGHFKVDTDVFPVSIAWMTLFSMEAGRHGV